MLSAILHLGNVSFEDPTFEFKSHACFPTICTFSMQMLAAILHLGNVSFEEHEGQHDASAVAPGPALETASKLLGVRPEELSAVLVTKQLHTTEGRCVHPRM